MLILPSAPKLLMPVPKWEWREPSLAQPKDQFGNQNRTRFVIRGWRVDGGLVHERWYDDFSEFDHDLWRISIEEPYEDIYWEYAAVEFVVSTSASNQTWTSPSNWNNANNSIEVIGGGATGALERGSATRHSTGGGGGGYSAITNFTVATPGTTTAVFRLEAAVSQAQGAAGASNGLDGKPAWFNGATLAASSVGADAGVKGVTASGSQNGGIGAPTTLAIGTVKRAGGRGGNLTGASGSGASGGGGAGGATGAGEAANDSISTGNGVFTAGGDGDVGDADGGNGSAGSSSATTSTGGAGIEWDASHGSGGGAGGLAVTSGATRTSTGGAYGAGAGGIDNSSDASMTSIGGQGIIVITYAPAGGADGNFFMLMN